MYIYTHTYLAAAVDGGLRSVIYICDVYESDVHDFVV